MCECADWTERISKFAPQLTYGENCKCGCHRVVWPAGLPGDLLRGEHVLRRVQDTVQRKERTLANHAGHTPATAHPVTGLKSTAAR